MPRLVRMYIRHVLIGFALSGLFVGALLALNVANLGHLVASSDAGLVAVFMLLVANGIVFAGVQFAVSVWLRAEGTGREGPPPRPIARLAAPVAVESGGNHRQP